VVLLRPVIARIGGGSVAGEIRNGAADEADTFGGVIIEHAVEGGIGIEIANEPMPTLTARSG